MAFDKDTASEAGKKSKRGADSQTKAIRERFSNILQGNVENIEKWLQEVAKDDPAKALDLLLKMSNMVLPKLRPVGIESDEEKIEGFKIRIINSRDELEPFDLTKGLNVD